MRAFGKSQQQYISYSRSLSCYLSYQSRSLADGLGFSQDPQSMLVVSLMLHYTTDLDIDQSGRQGGPRLPVLQGIYASLHVMLPYVTPPQLIRRGIAS
jgi:hypothetical protein